MPAPLSLLPSNARGVFWSRASGWESPICAGRQNAALANRCWSGRHAQSVRLGNETIELLAGFVVPAASLAVVQERVAPSGRRWVAWTSGGPAVMLPRDCRYTILMASPAQSPEPAPSLRASSQP